MRHAACLTALFLLLAGCGQNVSREPASEAAGEAAPPQRAPAPSARPAPDPGAGGVSALEFRAPEDWVPEPPSSSMRKAQYRLPGSGGADDAEVVVFFFGPDQGGGVEANLERWKGMFRDRQGEAGLQAWKQGGLDVTLLDVTGTYQAPPMAGGGQPRPRTRMLAAVVETPGGNWFVRLLGPRETVRRWEESFESYLRSASLPGGAS